MQFQLFIFFKSICLQRNFHGRLLSIRVISADGHYINNSLHFARKYAKMFVRGHYLFRVANVFLRTVRNEEQLTSKDKYPSIFLPQMEAIVFDILQIFFATRAVLKIGEYINNSLHLARKCARIFVRGHYLFRVANSDCEL